ncbi:XRE family transcriptional regulator [Devosia geojensis]|uniref:XRE family transcriptional regulator n=1 Tax=Devosia geojensis TaxID=443610 RepID=A0A0F5FU85_9HYPH|nr:helix-turn-helix domain-containing protein [Devosia geojensis]KKB12393.1 XRE family transcriptional regulator [Devosia geojensis]
MTKFGDDLIASMTEALAHARGENVPGIVVHEIDVDNIDPKEIRLHLGLTQERMAQVMGTSLSGYRKWEQQQRTPSGAARTLLRVMAKEPEAVLRALADEAA